MTDEQLFLANAFIDGELDARQRAIAESDPEVMREVAALQDIRTRLSDVPPATETTRADAISAALNAWSAQVDDGASVTRIGPGQLRRPTDRTAAQRARWRASTRLLGAAAAVVGLGMAGIVLTIGRGPSSSDSAASVSVDSDDGAVRRAPKSRSAAQSDSMTAASSEVLDQAMTARSEGTLEFSASGAEAMMESTDESAAAPLEPTVLSELLIVPMPTLQFTEQDLRTVVDLLTTSRPASSAGPATDSVVDGSVIAGPVENTSCPMPPSPTAQVVGETAAPNADSLRPNVRLIIVTNDVAGMAYAIDALTCQAVQATPLQP